MKKLSDMDDNEMLHNITSKIIIMIRRTQHAAATEELTKALIPIDTQKIILTLEEENQRLKSQLAIAKEALDKNVKTIGNFMDRLSVEGIGNPDISTARLGTIEALHCFKRSRSALEQIERGDK